MEVCGDLIANRGLIGALFSPVAVDSFLSAGLGLGRTVHGERPQEGEVSRKGISCERTFAAISSTADLEAKVAPLHPTNPSPFRPSLSDVAGIPSFMGVLQSWGCSEMFAGAAQVVGLCC